MRKSFGFLISTPSLTEGTSDFLLEVTPRREQTYFILLLQRGAQESSQRIRARCSLDLVPVGHSLLSAPPSAPGLSPWVCGGGGEDNNPFKGQEGAPIPGYLACPAPEAARVVMGSPVPLSAVTGVYSLLIQDSDLVDKSHNRGQQQAGGAGVPAEKMPSGPEPGLVPRIRDPAVRVLTR